MPKLEAWIRALLGFGVLHEVSQARSAFGNQRSATGATRWMAWSTFLCSVVKRFQVHARFAALTDALAALKNETSLASQTHRRRAGA